MTLDKHTRVQVCLVAAVVVAYVTARAQQPPAPTFRSGVEVTTLDVSIVDDNGRPVVDLKPEEFSVRIDGKERHVVRAEWIPLTAPTGGPAAPPLPPPPAGYSTNQTATATRGRLIVIAFDQPNIRPGAAMSLRSSLNGFIDRLQPADRIAAVPLGRGGVSTPFTSNRDEVKKAISLMNGDMELPSQASDFKMSSGEAVEIEDGDTATLGWVFNRECNHRRGTVPLPMIEPDCLMRLRLQASMVARSAKAEAQQSLSSLRGLLEGLRKIEAPKILVVVSEGFGAQDAGELNDLGSLAAAARTSLYVLRVDGLGNDVASGDAMQDSQSVLTETRMRSAGVELLASAARGDVFHVIGTGGPAVARLEREVSGYYLVGVESTPTDSDGKVHPVGVQVSRRNLTVRARRELTPDAAVRTEARTPKDLLTSAIRSPLLDTGLPMIVTTDAYQDADPQKLQIVIRAEVGRDYSASTPITVAYVIEDAKGTAVVNQLGDGKLPPKEHDTASPLVFSAKASIAPGDYTLKLAIVEGARVGSVEHAIHTGTLAAARPAPAVSAGSAGAPVLRDAPNSVPVIEALAFRRDDVTQVETVQRFRASMPADGRSAFDAGVTALTASDYAKAETSFKSAISAGLAGGNSAAALAYLGATYAASGRDNEAVGIWQAALVDGSAFPQIYEWLADALIRVRSIDEARSILREAVARWPNDERLGARLATLQPAVQGNK